MYPCPDLQTESHLPSKLTRDKTKTNKIHNQETPLRRLRVKMRKTLEVMDHVIDGVPTKMRMSKESQRTVTIMPCLPMPFHHHLGIVEPPNKLLKDRKGTISNLEQSSDAFQVKIMREIVILVQRLHHPFLTVLDLNFNQTIHHIKMETR